MRLSLILLAAALTVPASAQPVDTERGATHTVAVAPGDALLIRLANRAYGPASDLVPVAIVQPDGAFYDESETDPGVSLWLSAEAARYLPAAMPGTWTVRFSDEPTGAYEALTVELVAGTPALSLHEAVQFRDTAALRAAIDAAGFGVDAPNGRYETALMVAADAGHVDAVRMLLDAGADPNALAGTDGGGYQMTMSLYRPLHFAAGSGHAEVVDLLLDAGADPNPTDAQGMAGTPLISAVYGGHLGVVTRLVARGADAGARDEEGRTAAELAAELAEAEWTEEGDRPTLREIAALLAD